jgi:hypothetical protein
MPHGREFGPEFRTEDVGYLRISSGDFIQSEHDFFLKMFGENSCTFEPPDTRWKISSGGVASRPVRLL